MGPLPSAMQTQLQAYDRCLLMHCTSVALHLFISLHGSLQRRVILDQDSQCPQGCLKCTALAVCTLSDIACSIIFFTVTSQDTVVMVKISCQHCGRLSLSQSSRTAESSRAFLRLIHLFYLASSNDPKLALESLLRWRPTQQQLAHQSPGMSSHHRPAALRCSQSLNRL